MEYIRPAKLVDTNVPEAVLEEVKYNFIHSYNITKFDLIRKVFKDFLNLFNGKYPGYKECNTPYHDLAHTVDTLLLFSRIVDGYNIEKKSLPLKKVRTGIIATIFHDSGYIQKKTDVTGTGAKYTQVHEKKSIDFIRGYFKKIGLEREDFLMAKNMIKCTDLKIKLDDISFGSESEKIVGYIVGTADLMAQMSERSYLERLSLLYKEFDEAGVVVYDSEVDLLERTVDFYEGVAKRRIEDNFQNVSKYIQSHFRERYHVDSNLYMISIENQLKYLKGIIESKQESLGKNLRRNKRK